MTSDCINYFGRSVKSLEGVPYDYQWGCLANHDLEGCSDTCPFRIPNYAATDLEPIFRTEKESNPFEDLKRFLGYCRELGSTGNSARIPKVLYDKLTEDDLKYIEEHYGYNLMPYVRYESTEIYSTRKEQKPKVSTPKDYGLSLLKKRRK